MKPSSPAAFVACVVLAIGALGVGLTWPVWLILAGDNPLEAIRDGTSVVTLAIIGLAITVFFGVALQRLRGPTKAAAPPAENKAAGEETGRSGHRP